MKKVLYFFVIFILFLPSISFADAPEIEEGEVIENSYNVKTTTTEENAYILVHTRKAAECEYDFKEFVHGEGKKFEKINQTTYRAKTGIEEFDSYKLKVKCVVNTLKGKESMVFSVSRVSFFILENIDSLKKSVIEFKEKKIKYEDQLDISDINKEIDELENIIKKMEESVGGEDIEKVRLELSDGLKKRNDIDNLFIIKSFEFAVFESAKYLVIFITVVFVLLYFLTSFIIPYFRMKNEIKELNEKEEDMIKSRKNIQMLYFKRKIDEDTFNKMIVKEQEEINRTRARISNLKQKKSNLLKVAIDPENISKWFLQERISVLDGLTKWLERMDEDYKKKKQYNKKVNKNGSKKDSNRSNKPR